MSCMNLIKLLPTCWPTFLPPRLLIFPYSHLHLINLFMYAVLIIIPSPLPSLTVSQDNNTALHIAADIGRVAIVQVLIDRNANINALGKVRTYLTHRTVLYHRCIFPTPRYSDPALSVGSVASVYLDSYDRTVDGVFFSPPGRANTLHSFFPTSSSFSYICPLLFSCLPQFLHTNS